MLAERPKEAELSEFVAGLSCRIILPEVAPTSFGVGPLPPLGVEDRRRFARKVVVDSLNRAGLEYRQTLPAVPREPGWHAVYVVDVSRGGMRLLHFEPVYPWESFRVLLAGGIQRDAIVARCRRMAERCFSVGVRFSHIQEPG